MANDTTDLQALAGRIPDAHFMRGMIGFAATRLIEPEVVVPAPANLYPDLGHNRS